MYYSVCFNFVKKYPSLKLIAVEIDVEQIVVASREVLFARTPFMEIAQE